jgi:transcriptional regulator with XRE-family HTH domain
LALSSNNAHTRWRNYLEVKPLMTGPELRAKRAAHRIDGHTVCARALICRSHLSDIELERVVPAAETLQRISSALDSIIAERAKIAALVTEHGLSLAGAGF